MATAKLFKTGRSQAVRLPKEFRFEGNEVRIRKYGEGVLLEPMKKTHWQAVFDEIDAVGAEDFPDPPEQPPMPDPVKFD